MEWPDGRLLWPGSFSPMIMKLLASNAAAGRGTENRFFNPLEAINENRDADINARHIAGAYRINRLSKDIKIRASPNCVRLNWMYGNWPSVALIL